MTETCNRTGDGRGARAQHGSATGSAGGSYDGDVGAQRPGLQPGDRRADRGGRLRDASRRSTARSPPRRRRSRPGAPLSLSRRAELFFRIRAALPRPPRGPRAAAHGRARQGALRRARRGRARARGDRVRVRHPDAAQGRVLRAGLDRDRRLLDPPAARRRRRDHAVQLPGDGAHVDVGARARVRQHVRAQAVREGPVRVAPDGRAAQGGRRPGRRLQRRPRRQGRGRPRCSSIPTIAAISFVGSTPIAQLRLRDRHEARQARAGARRREEPHDRAARRRHRHGRRRGGQRRATARPASAAWRSPSVVAVGDVADPLVARDQGAAAEGARSAHGLEPGRRDGPARDARAPRQGRRRTSTRAPSRARRSSSTAASRRPDGDGFFLGVSLLDNVTPEMDAYRDEIFGPVLSVVRVGTYDEAVRLVNENPYGNGDGDLHPRRRRRAPVPVRGRRPGWSAINVPIPVPVAYYSFGGWKASLFGDSHIYGPEGINFYTRGKVVTTPLARPGDVARSTSASRRPAETGIAQRPWPGLVPGSWPT